MKDYRTIDFRPAPPGWRVWSVGTDPDTAGSQPLPGWLIQEEVAVDPHTLEDEILEMDPADRPRRVIAACYGEGDLEPAEHAWQILGPGEPDPTAEEISAAARHARERAERKRQRAAAAP